MSAAARLDVDNLTVKHWVLKHCEREEQTRMRFRVRGSFKDALMRIITEAVLIERESNKNSKAEWGYRKLSRLPIERPEWVSGDDISEQDECTGRTEERGW